MSPFLLTDLSFEMFAKIFWFAFTERLVRQIGNGRQCFQEAI
jgi:hypothetical protein